MRERSLIAAGRGDYARATCRSKSASALTWPFPFTCLPQASSKHGNRMPQRNNERRELNITSTRVFLMLAFAFLFVQLVIWILIRYLMFAP